MRRRFKKTLDLMQRIIPKDATIYDMGHENNFTPYIKAAGYEVSNNITDFDFDESQTEIMQLSGKARYCISFEILEHLLNPYAVLKSVKSEFLLVTVPLNVWFSNAYWGAERDRHFHEFEQRQFLWLLDATGWQVIEKGTWKITDKIGIRPFFRLFFPSYMWVLAKRK